MTSTRRFLLIGLSALVLTASSFVATGCHRKSRPELFTTHLTEIEGVQAIYTLRHPKLIIADLDKLMTAVPETVLLRMGLAQLTPYGYPEFSELATGSNIGVAMLEPTTEELKTGKLTVVGFAKLKEGGKIWTALKQSGLALQKHDEWTWIAKDAASFEKIKAPAAITAFIDRPQIEELRAWGRVTPALLTSVKELLLPKIQAKLSTRPAAEQKALLAYIDVLWSYLAQLHSIGSAIAFNDQGLTLTYSAQFLPDSATGIWLRYAPGPAPKIARSVPSDGLMSVVFRQNMDGQIAFVRTLLDALIAVDYPAGAELLKAVKSSYLAFAGQSDGSGVLTMNMTLPTSGQTPEIDMLGVYSGRFTEAQVTAFYENIITLSQKCTNAIFTAISTMTPHTPVPAIHQQLTENALTVDGTSFGSVITTTKTTIAGKKQTATMTQYYGVIRGNLVYATNETALREKVPALAAKNPVPNSVESMFKNNEIAVMAVHGEKIVDMVAKSAHIDLSDADIQAQIKTLKQSYAESGPITATIVMSQAQGTATISIPYKFVEQSMRLGQFASAKAKATNTPTAPKPVTP